MHSGAAGWSRDLFCKFVKEWVVKSSKRCLHFCKYLPYVDILYQALQLIWLSLGKFLLKFCLIFCEKDDWLFATHFFTNSTFFARNIALNKNSGGIDGFWSRWVYVVNMEYHKKSYRRYMTPIFISTMGTMDVEMARIFLLLALAQIPCS